MTTVDKTNQELLQEIAALRQKLEEANETLDAIRTGQVDALVIQNANGSQLYTLRGADQTYRIFIEQMKEGAVTLNRECTILYCNSRFAGMIGKPLEQVIGSSFYDLVPADQMEQFNALIAAGWNENSKGEVSLPGRNGKDIPFLLSLTTLQLDEDMALSVILTDLSRQKEVEKQLQQKNEQLMNAQKITKLLNQELEETVQKRTRELLLSKEHFRFLADNIPQVVWYSNAKGEIQFFNRYWMDYTGLTIDETKGWGWEKVIHPSDLPENVRVWKHSIETGEPFRFEHRFKRHDGKYRWHLGKAHAMRNEKGEIEMWIGTNADIHEQKNAMEKKDEFIGLASHELKTPLTSVKAYLQLLERSLDNDENKLYVSKANRHIQKLQDLISDLLDVSKIQAGKLELNKTEFDFDSFINESLESFQHTATRHRIICEGKANALVRADRHRIEQVLINLLSNAAKYSPKAEKILVNVSSNETNITVSITDHGIGISKDNLFKLFNKFYRAENVSMYFEGLGIGLFISSEIIRRHKGTVGVHSEEGKGSTFYFTLPI
jgi:two-component system CheB/CheR fusion protein